ncbi:MAG TPA: RNA polymerase sigma factor [Kofleriaceae bacterium]|nr:RNA polymerase sigma factor [Kofleriaceae bacterium]
MEPLHVRCAAFARGLCRSRSDADDLYQESLLRAFTRLDALRDEAAFRTWMYRIVISVHRNQLRKDFIRRLSPFHMPRSELARLAGHGDDVSIETLYRSTDWSPEAAEAARRARAALAALPTAQREAIVLFEIEGMLVAEIAAIQSVSESAVKSRLARGRERMRAHYGITSADAIPAAAGDPT